MIRARVYIGGMLCSVGIGAATLFPIATSAAESLEARVQRLEQVLRGPTLLDWSTRLDRLQREMRELTGQAEDQAHALQALRTQQQAVKADIDERLKELENRWEELGAAITALKVQQTSQASLQQNMAEQEQTAYKQALDAVREGRFATATANFESFLTQYPQSSFVPNAKYWLGEARLALKQYEGAEQIFTAILTEHPTHAKAPDAHLKLGLIALERGNMNLARDHLQKTVAQYPNSNAARLATERLERLQEAQGGE